jgi:hypothetical protein
MEPIDETLEHERGHVVGILVVDAQGRSEPLALAIEFVLGERRRADDVGQHVQPLGEAVPQDGHVGEREVGAGPDTYAPADRVHGVGNLLGAARDRALVEQRRHEVRDTELRADVFRRTRADDHAHADRRLLVLLDDHHLEAVGHGADLVRRELHRLCAERARRGLRRPVPDLRRTRRGHGDRGRDEDAEPEARGPGHGAGSLFGSFFGSFAGLGSTVITRRPSGAK